MSKLAGLLYNLKNHRFWNWPLLRWLRVLVVAIIVYLAFRRSPAWTVVLTTALLLASFALEAVWEKRLYVEFTPSQVVSPQAAPLQPEDKIHIRATGLFGVEGKHKKFANLEAYFRTFNSREHAIMAWVPPSRYLLIGKWPKKDLGLWYIFFRYDQIVDISPGTMEFSGKKSKSLRIKHMNPEGKGTEELVTFLSFSTQEEMQAVWADLIWDGGETQGPAG